MSGPLAGIGVVELAGLGPAPFCGMVLADLGADVIRVDRLQPGDRIAESGDDVLNRGKRSVAVDLKSPEGVAVVLRLVASVDVLIEGFRPGVAERLGVGPETCFEQNTALVYGRMTGWGQDGPLSGTAGHDIDYIAMSGVLSAIGSSEDPVPPLNLVGDFGGGGMLLGLGILAAVINAQSTGVGQVVDAAMVDGSALLAAMQFGLLSGGEWVTDRAANLLDGAAPFYSTYRTADGGHVAVGALEPQFFAELLEGLDLDPGQVPTQSDRTSWPEMRRVFAERFASRPRAEWESRFSGTDACVAPVLSMDEAPRHAHNVARGTFLELADGFQPAPAPRFSVTQPEVPGPSVSAGENTDAILLSLGYSRDELGKLRQSGVIA